jgi:hypothetical protein
MKIELYEIDDNAPDARWFWVILKWSDKPAYDGEDKIVPGTEHGTWYNAKCGHKATFTEAAQAAEAAYHIARKKCGQCGGYGTINRSQNSAVYFQCPMCDGYGVMP